MDDNAARTHASLSLITSLLDQLNKNGTLSDQDLKEILANAQDLLGMINPTFNDTRGFTAALTRVRKALG
jgi:hypothetical protein